MIVLVTILERHTLVAPLGLRFWDPVTEMIVGDSLSITAYPAAMLRDAPLELGGPLLPPRPSRGAQAMVTGSGVYVFHHLFGLREAENGAGDEVFWAALPATRLFTIEVQDTQGRFQPCRFDVTAPTRGLVTAPCGPVGSSLEPKTLGIPLYSTVARPAPPGMAVLYAELRDQLDPQGKAPAAWAMVEAHLPDGSKVRGIAGRDGRLALIFPYPPPLADSPLGSRHPPLTQQTWTLNLTVHYGRLAADAVPPLCPTVGSPGKPGLFDQPMAALFADLGGMTPLTTAILQFGRTLVLNKPDSGPAQPVYVSTGP